jgi:hypothetical protein
VPRPAPATITAYLAALEPERRRMIEAVRDTINGCLASGFEEGMQYGMPAWFVPHSLHPAGYHCDASQPVPFASVASTKSGISVYLFCMYIDADRVARFQREWKATGTRLDMGKSCIRVRKMEELELPVIASAVRGITVKIFLAEYSRLIPGGGGSGSRKAARKTAKKTAKKAAKKTAKKTAKKAAKKATKKAAKKTGKKTA